MRYGGSGVIFGGLAGSSVQTSGGRGSAWYIAMDAIEHQTLDGQFSTVSTTTFRKSKTSSNTHSEIVAQSSPQTHIITQISALH